MRVLSLFVSCIATAQCVSNNLGFQSLEPRTDHDGEPPVAQNVPIENPDTEPQESTVSTETTSSTQVGVASYYPPTTTTEVIVMHTAGCPFATPLGTPNGSVTSSMYTYTTGGTVVVQNTPVPEPVVYTYTINGTVVVQNTPLPVYSYTTANTLVVQSVSWAPCMTPTVVVQQVPTTIFEVTSTVNIKNVTQTTCDYSVETLSTNIIKTIYVQECREEIVQFFETPVFTVAEVTTTLQATGTATIPTSTQTSSSTNVYYPWWKWF